VGGITEDQMSEMQWVRPELRRADSVRGIYSGRSVAAREVPWTKERQGGERGEEGRLKIVHCSKVSHCVTDFTGGPVKMTASDVARGDASW
jgi:hypothetical protein